MKKVLKFIFLLLLFSCSDNVIKVSGDFERGSIGKLEETSPGFFRGPTEHWIKYDSIGDQYYWFYFRADNVKGKRLTFELTNLIGVYRGNPHIVYTDYTRPVFSYDQQNWSRIGEVSYDSASYTFRFTHTFEKKTGWIAYAHPYTCSRLAGLVNFLRESKVATVSTLSKTAAARDVQMIAITEWQTPDVTKKNILIIAAQHAGEDAGAFMAEGMIRFLTSESPEAKQARQKFIFFIVPLMNPDGFYHGLTRYNTKMEDLNNIWTDKNRSQPEVEGVKNFIDSLYASGNKIDLFIDIHNHTQFYTYNVLIFEDDSLDSLALVMEKYWPVRYWHSEFKGSSCAWMRQEGIPNGTIELSQSRIEEGEYLTIEDYLCFGEGAVKGIGEYFNDR